MAAVAELKCAHIDVAAPRSKKGPLHFDLQHFQDFSVTKAVFCTICYRSVDKYGLLVSFKVSKWLFSL